MDEEEEIMDDVFEEDPTSGTSDLENMINTFNQTYGTQKEKPKKIVDVDEGMQDYYGLREDLQLLNLTIKKLDEMTITTQNNIRRNLRMINPLKPFEQTVVAKRDELVKNMRSFHTHKRGALTDTALSDLDITEGVDRIMKTNAAKSKRPIGPELYEQMVHTVRANEALPLLPEEEKIPVKEEPKPPEPTPPTVTTPVTTPAPTQPQQPKA